MQPKQVVRGALFAVVVAAGVASAGHDLKFLFDVTPTTAGAVTDTKAYANYGTALAASNDVILPPGVLLAHADDRTSPVSPPPLNGDLVGEGIMYGDLLQDGCGNPKNNSFTMTWVEPVGSGAPAGTVAELKVNSNPLPGLTITKRAFVVKRNSDAYFSSAHYVISIPDMPDEFACSGSSSWLDMQTYGYARAGGTTTGRIFARNPSTVGTYNVFVEYKDTSGVVHSDSDTVTIN